METVAGAVVRFSVVGAVVVPVVLIVKPRVVVGDVIIAPR